MQGQSEAVWQTKYAKNIKIAYGEAINEDNIRILAYCQRNQGDDHKRFVFYKTGSIDAIDRENTYNATNKNYNDKKGIDITDFGQAVSITATGTDCPLYRDKFADIFSQVSVEGNLIKSSVSAMYKSTLKKLLTPLKEYTIDGTFVQYDEKAVGTTLTIPTTQVYGDDTKTFFENEDALLDMLTDLEILSEGEGMKVKVGGILGRKGMKALKKYDKANNKDYITTSEFESKLGKKLSIKKFDIMELIPIAGFDLTFPTTKGYIVVMLDQAMGYDSNKKLDSESETIGFKGAKFFNTTTFDNATIVDEKGIFLFKWNGEAGDRVVHTKEVS